MNGIAGSLVNSMCIMSWFLTREVLIPLYASINTSKSSFQNALFKSSLTFSIQDIPLFIKVTNLKESGRLVQALLLNSVRFTQESRNALQSCLRFCDFNPPLRNGYSRIEELF